MDIVTIIGLVAGAGTTFAALPDLVTMLKRRSSRGMNPRMAAITGSFQVLWVVYGILIGSTSVALWNIIAVVVNAFTVSAFLFFRRVVRQRVDAVAR
jgi:MtN3 and saliva related transmembrane protein